MRHYATDSPDAVARLIVLALLADGAVSSSELQLVRQHDIIRRVGIKPDRFNQVVQELFEDIQGLRRPSLAAQFEIGTESLDQLLAEIQQPALREAVLRTILDIADADQRVDGGEAVLLTRATQIWAIDLVDVAHRGSSRRHRHAQLRDRSASIPDA